MLPSHAGLTVEKIDRLYFCSECKVVFLFKSDALEHQSILNHPKMHEMPFEE